MRERLTDNPKRLMSAAAANSRREIPVDYTYKKGKAKHLKRILHNVSVALGTLTSSLNEFSRTRGTDLSPDGRLGGVGYIMALTDIKQTINSSVHTLSTVADCIADELTNPRWSVADEKETKDLIKEKDKAIEKVDEVSDDINPDDIGEGDEDEPSEEEPEVKLDLEDAPATEKEDTGEEPTEKPDNAPVVKTEDPSEMNPEAGFELKLASAIQKNLVKSVENSR